jgi:hypothetical protein
MVTDPWVVRRNVIRDEIENQLETSRRELSARDSQACGASEVFINDVAAHAVRRPDVVL